LTRSLVQTHRSAREVHTHTIVIAASLVKANPRF
jgi:hypothetical protein